MYYCNRVKELPGKRPKPIIKTDNGGQSAVEQEVRQDCQPALVNNEDDYDEDDILNEEEPVDDVRRCVINY